MMRRAICIAFFISLAAGSLAGCEPAESDQGRLPPVGLAPERPLGVSALGRLEPKDGPIQVAGPSQLNPYVVVDRLLVDEGDRVERDQVVAVIDSIELKQAEVARTRAELKNAELELRRKVELHAGDVISDSLRDSWQLKVEVAQAVVDWARADLALMTVRSPITGRVLEVYARDGERIDSRGILEVGRTDEMYAIAEVYETDISRVRIGQRATVKSPALAQPLQGRVDQIGLKVGRLETQGTDPAAKSDARVIEVKVRLDDSEPAASLMNLLVEIQFEP